MGTYKSGIWTAPGPGHNPALFIETPQGLWKAVVHEDDSTWHVRGPDPDNPEHYADGEVSTSDSDVRVGDVKGRAAAAKKRARAYIMAQIKKTGARTSDLKHWKVKFTRRGMEPPRPFGKTSAIVCATSRKEALEMVPASPGYPITASITEDPVSFPFRCRHQEAQSSHILSVPKTKRELDADIAEVLDKPYPS